MAHNQAKRHKPADIFETIPFFKAIKSRRDRDELKRVLQTEHYREGDVLFKYNDIGDKMYVVMEGEITISFPVHNIPAGEFKARYAEYTNLLKDMDSIAEIERKKALVVEREQKLEELELLKLNASSIESFDKNQKGSQKKINSVQDNSRSKRISVIKNA